MQANRATGGGSAAAPTGCFKCGRPGHWSRDCPSAPSSSLPTKPNPSYNPSPNPKFTSSSSKFSNPQSSEKPNAPSKRAPKTRPKLTPDLLLSEDGLGYVLRHFPRSFKYHGRGHEVSDLRNLIGLYAQWHSRLLPYYSFDQFIQKVEQVGATKRVRRCVAELRDRVARGEDPTKLHEPPAEQVAPECEQEGTDIGDHNVDVAEPPLDNHGADEFQEEMVDEIYRKATEESLSSLQEERHEVSQGAAASEQIKQPEDRSLEGTPKQAEVRESTKVQLTDEQKARIEANRQKALERAAARAHSSQAT